MTDDLMKANACPMTVPTEESKQWNWVGRARRAQLSKVEAEDNLCAVTLFEDGVVLIRKGPTRSMVKSTREHALAQVKFPCRVVGRPFVFMALTTVPYSALLVKHRDWRFARSC